MPGLDATPAQILLAVEPVDRRRGIDGLSAHVQQALGDAPCAGILQTASDLFYSQGVRATEVEAIAKGANTTKMSLYKYFPSKDELVVAFLRQRDEDFTTWFVEHLEGKADNPKAKLLAIFDVIVEWLDIPEFRGCAFINAAAEFPVEGNPVH